MLSKEQYNCLVEMVQKEYDRAISLFPSKQYLFYASFDDKPYRLALVYMSFHNVSASVAVMRQSKMWKHKMQEYLHVKD